MSKFCFANFKPFKKFVKKVKSCVSLTNICCTFLHFSPLLCIYDRFFKIRKVTQVARLITSRKYVEFKLLMATKKVIKIWRKKGKPKLGLKIERSQRIFSIFLNWSFTYKWQIPSEILFETTTSGKPLTPSSLIHWRILTLAAWASAYIWEKVPSNTVTPMVKPCQTNE